MPSLTEDIDLAKQNEELRAANRRLQRALARAKEKSADLEEAVYRAARDAATVVGTPKPIQSPPRGRRKSPEVALLALTDWQGGKRTASYNLDVCEERIRLAIQKAIKLTEIQRSDHPVDEIVVALQGDLVEGANIFPGQAFEIDAHMFDQVFRIASLVEQSLISLLGAFSRVTVYEVPGNHGRVGRRGENPRESNLDMVVYRIVHERLSAQPNLKWDIGSGWYRLIEIGDYRALLTHGDAIKSFGGNVPAFGILRKANAWASGAIPHSFSSILMGHFHTPMQLTMANGGTVWVTGSPESDNEYAAEFVAARGRPSQRLIFVDPRKGRETSDYVLWLDD